MVNELKSVVDNKRNNYSLRSVVIATEFVYNVNKFIVRDML